MVVNERNMRRELAMEAAHRMMTAARTAPKGKGIDVVEVCLITDEDINRVSDKMYQIGEESGLKFFFRDSENILHAEVVVLIGTRRQLMGLNCGHCGFPTCASKPETAPCALNAIDVGIAIGSACAAATDSRVDTRVMFSAGLAAQKLDILGEDCECVIAIPISISSKNPFFDRKPKKTV